MPLFNPFSASGGETPFTKTFVGIAWPIGNTTLLAASGGRVVLKSLFWRQRVAFASGGAATVQVEASTPGASTQILTNIGFATYVADNYLTRTPAGVAARNANALSAPIVANTLNAEAAGVILDSVLGTILRAIVQTAALTAGEVVLSGTYIPIDNGALVV